MKRNLIIAILVMAVLVVAGCVKSLEKEGIFLPTTTYKGRVIEKSENAPMKGVKVSLSDGTHVHASAVTGDDGRFEFDVNFDEINDGYKLHLECQGYPSMTEALKGMGQDVFDYKDIIFFDKGNSANWPVVTTAAVIDITSTSAKTGGTITYSGAASITARGVCYGLTHEPTIDGSHTSDGTGTGTFTSNLIELTPNTTYYVRAYATNQNGTYYGNEQEFSSVTGLPTITIDEVTNVTVNTAVCGGSIVSNGGFAITDKGLVWGTAQYPTINDNHVSVGNGDTPFTCSMTNLTINTTYYVRAYAINSQGTSYSSQKMFTTHNGLPVVTTTDITIDGNSVISGGNVTDDGGSPITARGICYGTIPHPDITSTYSHTNNGTGTGYFSSLIDSCASSGTLYIRAYATNANGTSYGNQVTIDGNYLSLPTFMHNGFVYKVAPDPHNTYSQYISWQDAKTYCESQTICGYSDWRMPTIEELTVMYQNKNQRGGFVGYYSYNSGSYTYRYYPMYHSSSPHGSYYHYGVNFSNGSIEDAPSTGCTNGSYNNYGYDFYRCHVRPIRIDH